MSEARLAEMIAEIAHELRSPLTSLKGFSSMLAKRWDRFTDEQRHQFVETIYADAERMARIVSEVLDLARLEAGRLELSFEPCEVAPVVHRALGSLTVTPGVDRVSVEISDGVVAWADPVRLEHVVGNLIENAVRFSEEGPVTVTASHNDEVEIEVSDQGEGLHRDMIEGLLAGPAQAAGDKAPAGSGLGLYLSRMIVAAHGGSLEVSSEAGVGSTFTLRLPVPKEAV